MSIHRYSPCVPVTAAAINRQIAVGTATISRRTLTAIDVSLSNDAAKEDLDAFMAFLGAGFVATSPLGAALAPYEGGVATADATPAVALAIPTVDNTTYFVEAKVAVRRSTGPSGGVHLNGTFRRDAGAGTLVQIGTTDVVSQKLEDAWSATFAVDTGTGEIRVLVTGAAMALRWYVGALVTEVQ